MFLLAVTLPRTLLAVSLQARDLLPRAFGPVSLLALPGARVAVPELLAMPRRLPVRGLVLPLLSLLALPWRLSVPGLVLPLLGVAWLAPLRLALPNLAPLRLALAWLFLTGLLVVRLAGWMRLRHCAVIRREERTGRPVAGRLVTHSCEATLAA